MKAKLLNPENSNILKQVLESKKRIEQAKEELTQHRAEDKKITSAQLTEPTVEWLLLIMITDSYMQLG